MILEAKNGVRGRVVDLDTGKSIPKVRFLNTDTGYIEAWRTDGQGNILKNEVGELQWYAAKGRFKFIEAVTRSVSINMGAEKCAKCTSPLTLLGDDLCPSCRAKDRGQKNPMISTVITPQFDKRCHCGALANYSVGDEVEVTPEVDGKQLYSRGATVGRHYYCAKHYKPPRLLDSKGEVIQELESNRP